VIDFYGSGFDAAEKMGLIYQLREKHYPVPKLVFVNGKGQKQATFELQKFRKLLNFRHFNFMRGDLASVPYESVKNIVPVRFGISVTKIHQFPDSVREIET